jgi:hypothetical protein
MITGESSPTGEGGGVGVRMAMRPNEGVVDRSIRIGLGVIFLVVGIWGSPPLPLLWQVVGAYAVITGAVGHCLLYDVLGITTVKRPG